jgi:hypothetical protein
MLDPIQQAVRGAGSMSDAAWDVWTIFGPEAVWRAAGPPMPRVLMDQLPALAGDPRFSHLDSGKFAGDALALMAASRKAAT